MINKLIIPLLKKYGKLFLGISLSLALSVGLLFGIVSGADSTDYSLDRYALEYRYGDVIITTNLLTSEELSKLNNINGIKTYNKRLSFYAQGKLNNGRFVNLRFFSYDYRDYTSIYFYKIDESSEYPNVAINNSFLESNDDIDVKDTIEVKINNEIKTFCIGKSITTPECVKMILNEFIYGSNPDLAYIYIIEDYLIGTEYENKYNQITIFFEDWANEDEVIDQIEDVIGKDNVINIATYDNSIIRKNMNINLEPIRSLANILPTAFFVIVIAISFLFLTQIIKQSRKDIGILKMLGYKSKDIFILFSKLILITSLFSVVLGTMFGLLFMSIITRLYSLIFNIPKMYHRINIPIYLISIVISILCGQIAVLFSIKQINSISPKEALENEIKRLSDKDIKISSLFNKYNSRIKYGISSILKNKKRFIFTTLCLTASVTIIFCSWAFYDSKDELRNSYFNDRIKYDYQLFYNREINDDDLNKLSKLEAIEDYEESNYVNTTIHFEDREVKVTIRGIDEDTKLVGLYKYQSISDGIGEGLIFEKHIAEKLGVEIGDVVTINNKQYVIEGMVNEYIDRFCYIKNSNLKDVDEIYQYSIILNSDDEKAVVEFANNEEAINIISTSYGIKKGVDAEFDIYNIAVYIIIACALIIGFVVVYNTILTNLFEQKKELSVLRTIGFKVKDISKLWAVQTSVQTVISLFVGLLLGSDFARFALKKVSTKERDLPYTSYPKQYLLTIIIVIAYVFFTHVIAIRSISKWNLVENTKEKD